MVALSEIVGIFNSKLELAGTVLSVYDYFHRLGETQSKETIKAIRQKSKEAYKRFCDYQQYRRAEIGKPVEKDIVGYWEQCLHRNVLPSAEDMVSLHIASKEEAEMMLPYLLEAWLENIDFATWLQGLLTSNKLDKLSGTLVNLQQNLEALSLIMDELERQGDFRDLVTVLRPDRIIADKHSCSPADVKDYFIVNNRFDIMHKVISAEQDIPYPAVNQKLEALLEDGAPTIIAGNGGLGKTSLMLRAAVRWAARGRLAIWLPLTSKEIITEQRAAMLFDYLIRLTPDGERILLCIDNPFEGRASFTSLQNSWPRNTKLQLFMTERANRLSLLADPTQDALLGWFDGAKMVLMQGTGKTSGCQNIKGYESFSFPEIRRKAILDKCASFLVGEGLVSEQDKRAVVQKILDQFGKPSVSLVELIYRTLFELRKVCSKPESIQMDWEEWVGFLHAEFPRLEDSLELYGVIAASKIFRTSMSLALFCRHFDLKERVVRSRLGERMLARHIEPVIYNPESGTLQPKHDVIAELFFLFNKEKISINSLMLDLLGSMDENEIEKLLSHMVIKREMQNEIKYHVGQIQYWDYMECIYQRIEQGEIHLSEQGNAQVCLGFLWAGKKQPRKSGRRIPEVLQQLAPALEPSLLLLKLYTEWGIWAGSVRDDALAEEKFRGVMQVSPKDIQSRTELGRLLSKQRGREKEAEEVLRESANKKSSPKMKKPSQNL